MDSQMRMIWRVIAVAVVLYLMGAAFLYLLGR